MSSPRRDLLVRARPEIEALSAYRLRRDAAVRLNQNENPLDWPKELKAEVMARVMARPWNRYPPVDSEELRRALADASGVDQTMIAVTNGSNEAILALVETFASGRRVVFPTPGYSMARPLAVVGGATVDPVLLQPDFSLDVAAMIRAIDQTDRPMVFVASPNNPTGNAFSWSDLEAILDAAQGLVVLDEAYVNFARGSLVSKLSRYPHLAILRTASKAFALAGARVGWITANEPIIGAVRKALPPYNLNVFAQEAALAALARPDLVATGVERIIRERTRLGKALGAIRGVHPYPSDTNFILFRTEFAAQLVFERLLERGVLVRDVSTSPLLERCLRVSVGTPEENDQFLGVLRGSLGDA